MLWQRNKQHSSKNTQLVERQISSHFQCRLICDMKEEKLCGIRGGGMGETGEPRVRFCAKRGSQEASK